MIQNEHPIDELFEKELKNFSVNPPEMVWSDIEKNLNRKKRIPVIFIRLGYAAGLALLLGSAGVWYYSAQNHKSEARYRGSDNKNLTVVSKGISGLNNANIANSASLQTDKKESFNPKVEGNTDNNSIGRIYAKVATIKNINAKINNPEKSQVIANGLNSGSELSATVKTVSNSDHLAQNTDINKSDNIINYDLNSGQVNNTNENLTYVNPMNVENLTSAKQNKIGLLKFREQLNESSGNNENVEEEKPKYIQKWVVEAQFAPTYAYRTISGQTGSNSANNFDSFESGILSYSGTVKMNYKYSAKWSFQVGLCFSQMGQQISKVYIDNGYANEYTLNTSKANVSSVQNSFGSIVTKDDQNETINMNYDNTNAYPPFGTNSTTIKLTSQNALSSATGPYDNALLGNLIFRNRYLELPMYARYKLNSKRISFFLTFGANAGVLVNQEVLIDRNGSKEKLGYNEGLERFSFNAVGGFGLEIPVRRNISILLEPTFKYHLTPLSRTNNMDTHLYSYNFFTGIGYSF